MFNLLSIQQLLEKNVDPEFPDYYSIRRQQGNPDQDNPFPVQLSHRFYMHKLDGNIIE